MKIPIKVCTKSELNEFQANPMRFVMQLRDEFEDIVRVKMGNETYIFPFKSNYIKIILNEKQVGRTSFSKIFTPIAGGSLILNEGEVWKRQRKMLSPFFFLPKLDISHMSNIANKSIENWADSCRNNEPVDAKLSVIFFCMGILSELVFGDVRDTSFLNEIYMNWNMALKCFTKSMVEIADQEDLAKMNMACKKVENIILEMISEKRKNCCLGNDILSTLILNFSQEDKNLSDTEIMKNIKGLFVAGFETISGALSWFLLDIATNKDWQDAIREQVLQEDFDIHKDIGAIKQCYDETLRLHPPLVFIDRALKVDVDLLDFSIYAGEEILMCPYVVHRDKRYWSQPLEYKPDRVETSRYLMDGSYCYFPYGGGLMRCMGERISVMERNTLLLAILSNYKIDTVNGEEVEEDNALILRPKKLNLKIDGIGDKNE